LSQPNTWNPNYVFALNGIWHVNFTPNNK